MTVVCALRCAFLALILSLAMTPAPVRAAEPYEIPAIASLTGIYAFIGKGTQDGLSAAENVINAAGGIHGRPIKFVILDDSSSPQVSLQLANGLIAKHAPFFVGTTATATCLAVAPVLTNGPVMYCVSPSLHPAVGSYAFSANVSSEVATLVYMRYLRQRGLKRIAILAATDASGQDQERSADAALAYPANRDFTIVAREHFAPADVSVAAQLSRIKASNPQAILLLCVGTPFGLATHGIADSGLDVPVMTSNGNATYAGMKQFSASLPRELLFPVQPPLGIEAVSDRAVRERVALYRKSMTALGAKPDGLPASAWDPAFLLFGALQKYGLNPTPVQIRSYLSNVQDYAGALGRYDFHEIPQRGLGETSVIISRWDPRKDWWSPVSHTGGAPL